MNKIACYGDEHIEMPRRTNKKRCGCVHVCVRSTSVANLSLLPQTPEAVTCDTFSLLPQTPEAVTCDTFSLIPQTPEAVTCDTFSLLPSKPQKPLHVTPFPFSPCDAAGVCLEGSCMVKQNNTNDPSARPPNKDFDIVCVSML